MSDPMREWTRSLDAELARLVVVSPHFDDAVLGAGQLLARHPGATVVTVLGGAPDRYPDPPGAWDALGGFGPGDDVVAARRAEDHAALEALDATAIHLDFPEHTYLPPERRPAPEVVAPALEDAIFSVAPTAVLFPFGLGNPDHGVTHDATRLVLERRRDDAAWYCYEDAGYKHIPGLLAWRIGQLFRAGLWPTPAVLSVDPSTDRKVAALAHYRSQLRPLDERHGLQARIDAGVPEQFWRLAPPPAGWEGLARAP
jgi:LmbE family N-acetylglucosaminyl deacetylase